MPISLSLLVAPLLPCRGASVQPAHENGRDRSTNCLWRKSQIFR
jgi:hypothetical protein